MSPYCTYCGNEIEDSWNACPNCGSKLKESNVPQTPVRSQPNPYQQTQQQLRNPYQTQQVQPYQKKYGTTGNNFGIASIICGILGLVLGFAFIGPFLGIPAIILGGLGISRDESGALGAVGIVLGIIDLIFAFFFWFWMWFPWFLFPW